MADTCIPIRAAARTYPVLLGEGLLARAGEALGELVRGRRLAIVTQRKLRRLFGPTLLGGLGPGTAPPLWLEVPDGERAKTMAWAERCCAQLARDRFTRGDLVVALGGGVVGDLGGFVASIYLRGVEDFVQVPTSLLAQVDSSVGGKVAVNLAAGKNLVGAFHPPSAVLIDPLVLRSLPARQVRAGAAEVVKYGLLGDAAFYARCEAELPRPADWTPFLEAAVRAKARVVEADELERGERRGLNLGHTLGHALEAAGGFRELLHGEAVALGMRYVYRLAAALGEVPEAVADRVDGWLVDRALSPSCPRHRFDKLLRIMARDKKADAAGLRWVLPTGIGSWRLAQGLPETTLERVYQELVEADRARTGAAAAGREPGTMPLK